MMERYLHDEGENTMSREDIVTVSMIVMSDVSLVSEVHSEVIERME